jgi:hypothetical protein
MDCGDWELAGAAQDKARRKTRKRNDAFREQLRQQQAQRREVIKLRMAGFAAVAAWGVAVVQLLH